MSGTEEYRIILDLPSDHPALGFAECANALRQIVEQSNPQFAMGIFGTWGSGKTTLMREIAKSLSPQNVIKVEFNAWRYEKEAHLIVPLLDCVREAVARWSEGKDKDTKAKAIKAASTVGRAIKSVLAGVSLKVGLPAAIELSYEANKSLADVKDQNQDEKDAKTPGSFYHATFNALAKTFQEFVGDQQNRRIVVFIDDLDRCLPQGALDVLEAMKLFFDFPGFVFIVGLDQVVVQRYIDSRYRPDGLLPQTADGTAAAPAPLIRGADYIKKIFQVPYGIAPVAVAQLNDFFRAICEEAALPSDQQAEFETIVGPHLRYTIGETGVNPRDIKRYLNTFTLLRKIKPYLIPDVILAVQTISLRDDWRMVQQALLTYGSAFTDALERQANKNELTAVQDLDESLAGIPEPFLRYVEPGGPGASLLMQGLNIDEYLYAGEATRSASGSFVIDAVRSVARLSAGLRKLKENPADQAALGEYTQLLYAAFSAVESLGSLLSPQDFAELTEWKKHSELANVNDQTGFTEWRAAEDGHRRSILNALMDLYRTSNWTKSPSAA